MSATPEQPIHAMLTELADDIADRDRHIAETLADDESRAVWSEYRRQQILDHAKLEHRYQALQNGLHWLIGWHRADDTPVDRDELVALLQAVTRT
ncbi:hypothetical protein SacmaDRAFT_1864 [Saccharomonospora marina XMU15]|uniref:Uncharacterized protein n=1 Tax=Saccharomonospora marina XMU15 TaxID=882083 RepID=H5X6I4_9PSEU|nr:hypothetical protein [Saccharomonospora marina]EHR50132.1 hypothetical protein SacmaDRAFT_1864 [Saccharomonospora marina XMU15]